MAGRTHRVQGEAREGARQEDALWAAARRAKRNAYFAIAWELMRQNAGFRREFENLDKGNGKKVKRFLREWRLKELKDIDESWDRGAEAQFKYPLRTYSFDRMSDRPPQDAGDSVRNESPRKRVLERVALNAGEVAVVFNLNIPITKQLAVAKKRLEKRESQWTSGANPLIRRPRGRLNFSTPYSKIIELAIELRKNVPKAKLIRRWGEDEYKTCAELHEAYVAQRGYLLLVYERFHDEGAGRKKAREKARKRAQGD